MKTTIDIADALFLEAKQVAERDKSTFRNLVEEGLRLALSERRRKGKGSYRLADTRVHGNGLQPGIDLSDWVQVRSIIYEGRGG